MAKASFSEIRRRTNLTKRLVNISICNNNFILSFFFVHSYLWSQCSMLCVDVVHVFSNLIDLKFLMNLQISTKENYKTVSMSDDTFSSANF